LLFISTTKRRARLAAERVAIKRRLGLRRALREQGQEKLVRLFALAASRFKEAAQDAVVFQTFV
jgi:hypothetical protein